MKNPRRMSTKRLETFAAASVPFIVAGLAAQPAAATSMTTNYIPKQCFVPGQSAGAPWRKPITISNIAGAPFNCYSGYSDPGWITTKLWGRSGHVLFSMRNKLGGTSSAHQINENYSVLAATQLTGGNLISHEVVAISHRTF
jgi:hypothetical protein